MSRKKGPLSYKTKKRIYSIFSICIIVYAFLIYRLVDIKILKCDKYKKMVEMQSMDKIELNSGRGIIYDRNNIPITDKERQSILIVPKSKLNNSYETIKLIKKATNISEEDIFKEFEKQVFSSVIEIETNYINNKMKSELEKNNILVEEKTLRYSNDKILSHTIGYLKKSDKTAQSGIEKSMDSILNNTNEKYVSVFKAGNIGNSKKLDILEGSVKTVEKSETNKHLKLTIDYEIQKKVEKILDKEENPSSVVISNVETGELLSICSRPNFNQNDIAKYSNSRNGELENRAIRATYPPGSVFKIVVLYAALENGVIDSNYTYNCQGKAKVGNTDEILKCHKINGHGVESLDQAFANSCNTAFLDIAMKVGKDKILEAVEKLKLSDQVGIGLDEEKNSKVPKDISIRNLAIGQADIEFTPLQINQLTQIVANNGTYKPLYLYDSIINNDKKILKTFKTTKQEELISPYTMTKIKSMMKKVSKEGTAKDLKDLDGGCGVKTGTAQSSLNKKEISHGWITGFYPEESPKYAITVIVEGTENNNKSATPIFKEISKGLK